MATGHILRVEEDPESGEEVQVVPSKLSAAARVSLVFVGLLLVMGAVGVSTRSTRAPQASEEALEQDLSEKGVNWLYNGAFDVTTTMNYADVLKNAPRLNLTDGNPCGDDEELFGNLCYLKCTKLTSGAYPIRTSAFSCCASHPCGFRNQKVLMKMPCDGFDVGGNINGEKGECPHEPGACLLNEEMLLGICYKKCSLLTNNLYPTRVAAATCCKANGLECMNPKNLKTNFREFDVGGGTAGDARKAHKPLKYLTEKGYSK